MTEIFLQKLIDCFVAVWVCTVRLLLLVYTDILFRSQTQYRKPAGAHVSQKSPKTYCNCLRGESVTCPNALRRFSIIRMRFRRFYCVNPSSRSRFHNGSRTLKHYWSTATAHIIVEKLLSLSHRIQRKYRHSFEYKIRTSDIITVKSTPYLLINSLMPYIFNRFSAILYFQLDVRNMTYWKKNFSYCLFFLELQLLRY